MDLGKKIRTIQVDEPMPMVPFVAPKQTPVETPELVPLKKVN